MVKSIRYRSILQESRFIKSMSWRTVVISNGAKLDYQLGYLVVRSEQTLRIHLDEIYILMVESTAVSLTAALLNELSKKKVKVIFCDEKRNPSSELNSYYGAHDTSAKIRTQILWSVETKAAVWTEIVREKIRKQAQYLSARKKVKESELLVKYIHELQNGDTTNREGHAAKVYFNGIFGIDFTRSAETAINAALNYGYSLLLSMVNREIVACGYLTQLGLFHDNMFNSFNLGSDLMEPFRPIVDALVVMERFEQFETEQKRRMLRMFSLEVYINGKSELLSNAIRIYVHGVFDALNENDTSLIRFYEYEF